MLKDNEINLDTLKNHNEEEILKILTKLIIKLILVKITI